MECAVCLHLVYMSWLLSVWMACTSDVPAACLDVAKAFHAMPAVPCGRTFWSAVHVQLVSLL